MILEGNITDIWYVIERNIIYFSGGDYMYNEYEEVTPNYFNKACPVVEYKDVSVCVPVEVKPFADVGKIKTDCVGKPVVKCDCKECDGKVNETCKFTITQKLRVEVPVTFGAKTEVGKVYTDCKCDRHTEEDCGCFED